MFFFLITHSIIRACAVIQQTPQYGIEFSRPTTLNFIAGSLYAAIRSMMMAWLKYATNKVDCQLV